MIIYFPSPPPLLPMALYSNSIPNGLISTERCKLVAAGGPHFVALHTGSVTGAQVYWFFPSITFDSKVSRRPKKPQEPSTTLLGSKSRISASLWAKTYGRPPKSVSCRYNIFCVVISKLLSGFKLIESYPKGFLKSCRLKIVITPPSSSYSFSAESRKASGSMTWKLLAASQFTFVPVMGPIEIPWSEMVVARNFFIMSPLPYSSG